MLTAIKVVVFVASLGVDTLIVAAALGARQRGAVWRTALAFAAAEAAMPVVGLGLGNLAGRWVGMWASVAGGGVLVALAVWMIAFDRDRDDAAQDGLSGLALVLAALSVSLDELAAGFSIGLVGVPVALTVGLIALQSAAVTVVGLRFGQRLRPLAGEGAERAAAGVLGLLGVWVLVEAGLRLAAAGVRP